MVKSSPQTQGSAKVTPGPLLSPSLCLVFGWSGLWLNAPHFFPERALVFWWGVAHRVCTEWSPCQVLFPALKCALGLLASCATGLIAKSLFHLFHSFFVHSHFGFKKAEVDGMPWGHGKGWLQGHQPQAPLSHLLLFAFLWHENSVVHSWLCTVFVICLSVAWCLIFS